MEVQSLIFKLEYRQSKSIVAFFGSWKHFCLYQGETPTPSLRLLLNLEVNVLDFVHLRIWRLMLWAFFFFFAVSSTETFACSPASLCRNW